MKAKQYIGPLASAGDLFSTASFRTSHDNNEEITIQIRELNVEKAIYKILKLTKADNTPDGAR